MPDIKGWDKCMEDDWRDVESTGLATWASYSLKQLQMPMLSGAVLPRGSRPGARKRGAGRDLEGCADARRPVRDARHITSAKLFHSEQTLVEQRTNGHRPAQQRTLVQQVDAQRRTLAQLAGNARPDACRQERTLVQLAENARPEEGARPEEDARPAARSAEDDRPEIGRSSRIWDARPELGRSSRIGTLVQKIGRSSRKWPRDSIIGASLLKPEIWTERRPGDATAAAPRGFPGGKSPIPPSNPSFLSSMLYMCS
ncbi:hypothetical protein LR48_Vigan03g117000 [Vigna angularis]|uniref:Uncharacterized protein n=1 Tax=Phaseolus angularis TaxID=3914 RepID=A0A0L9U4N9_PHAAN|nr:hypothetical protein LR48_Vigan03g117000 [Vigna angularis]